MKKAVLIVAVALIVVSGLADAFYSYGEYKFKQGAKQERAENGGTLLTVKNGECYQAVVVLHKVTQIKSVPNLEGAETSKYYYPPQDVNLQPNKEYVIHGDSIKPVEG